MPATEVADIKQIIGRVEACVREAGALARSMFQTSLKTWIKGESSPVSEADIAVDTLLRNRLHGDRSGYGWLSEESTDDPQRLDARRVWIVDPIDGTRAYIAGQPEWAISVALIENGRPIVACLYAPALEEFFIAAAGSGATLNGVPIFASNGAALGNVRIAGPKGLLTKLAQIAPPFTAMPRVPSLALRLARVAEGTLDVAFAGGNSHDWDLAAADLLVHEAGGALTPLTGGPLIYNRPQPRHGALVAAGLERHATVIALLSDEPIASP